MAADGAKWFCQPLISATRLQTRSHDVTSPLQSHPCCDAAHDKSVLSPYLHIRSMFLCRVDRKVQNFLEGSFNLKKYSAAFIELKVRHCTFTSTLNQCSFSISGHKMRFKHTVVNI